MRFRWRERGQKVSHRLDFSLEVSSTGSFGVAPENVSSEGRFFGVDSLVLERIRVELL